MSDPTDRYGHLRPVPPPVSGSEALDPAPEQQGTPGLTAPQTRSHSGRFITDVVVELGYLSRERVDQAISEARVAGRSPEALMVEGGVLSADQLSRAIAERYGLDHVDLNIYHVDMGAANLVTVQTARRFHAVPVGYVDAETLLVAMADPANVLAVDDMQMMTGLNCRVAVAAEVDIEALISRLNSLESAVSEAVSEDEEEASLSSADVTELRESADDAPVIKLVYSILGQAVNEGASDVHFEIEEKDMRVRFRVDGVLSEAARVPRRMVAGVVSRIKIMSELDIAEKRVPQDGRVAVNVNDRRVDLRVVTVPTERGEGATIRILDKTEALRTLDELGLLGDARAQFTDAYNQAYGAVLVTGPTGSGKSTTLYSALAELNSVSKNIITIEDPVEYQMPGINQMGVNRKAGLDFATGLRSILRADPDVIMVGEVRDPETARIAIEAALTGHMVLTTLHTNDAPSADHPAGEDGHRVVPDRLGGRLRRRPAARPHALSGLQASHGARARDPRRCRLPRRQRRRGLGAGRLRPLRRHRLPGPDRDLLGDADVGDAQGHDRRQRRPGRADPPGPRRRHAHPPRGRPRQGQPGPDEHRRGNPGRRLASPPPPPASPPAEVEEKGSYSPFPRPRQPGGIPPTPRSRKGVGIPCFLDLGGEERRATTRGGEGR